MLKIFQIWTTFVDFVNMVNEDNMFANNRFLFSLEVHGCEYASYVIFGIDVGHQDHL